MALASAWLEILGLPRRAPRRPAANRSHTIYGILGGGASSRALAMVAIALGTVAVNAMNDYTGSLSLQAAGLRIQRIYLGGDRRRPRFLVHPYLNTGDFADELHQLPAVHQLLDLAVRRRRPGRLVAPPAAGGSTQPSVDFASLPTGIDRASSRSWSGFVVGIPFQNSSLGYSWGGPFNYVTANYLHGADLAYYVGAAWPFLIYWFGAASRRVRAEA